jgi:hypothetical protein
MPRSNAKPLDERVSEAAEAALAAQNYVSWLDILLGTHWLDPNTARRWQRGEVDCLQSAIQTRPARLAEAHDLFHRWALAKGLVPTEVDYVARTPQQQRLRFTASGNPAMEQFCRTHWLSPGLPDAKRQQVIAKANRPAELVVVQPLKDTWTCHRCGKSGDMLIMENPGPACLRCVGLDDLEFLPAGDALLTRRAKAKSARHAVVVRFSRTRKRYERQGLLVEPQALSEAARETGRNLEQ